RRGERNSPKSPANSAGGENQGFKESGKGARSWAIARRGQAKAGSRRNVLSMGFPSRFRTIPTWRDQGARRGSALRETAAPAVMRVRTFLVSTAVLAMSSAHADTAAERVESVAKTPGFVALWDFVKREADAGQRFLAHVPAGAANDYALDAGNYVKDYWGEGR